jgi:hypothetical protein
MELSFKSEIPPRSSSKQAFSDLKSLEEEERHINDSIRVAKKKLKAQGSFNAQFWTEAAEVENLLLERHHLEKQISLRDFHGSEAVWKNTDEAKALFEKIRAQEVKERICHQRSQELKETGNRTLRAAFMKLFTSSKMGLNIKQTGAGARSKKMQSDFQSKMIDLYGSRHESQKHWLWCPVLGDWEVAQHVTTAHLFAYMHGQDAMDAVFGKAKKPELFSPRNGLLISSTIEKFFDSGKLVIVPDVPSKPSAIDIRTWIRQEPRGYKVRIIDPTWEMLDQFIRPQSPTKWRDLDNKRLEFRTPFRPRARYLYFHYCVQILRHTWQQNGENSLAALRDEVGKPFWGTPGRYVNKKMLKALVEELGHECDDLLQGSSCDNRGDRNLLLESASKQVATRKTRGDLDDDEDSTGSDEDRDTEDESSD